MELLKFNELSLPENMLKAIEEMGFETSTEIQTKAIPLVRDGADVIGKSQTGTGKTMAFAIPAVEMINTKESKPTVQVLILCPTRELAQQACEEIRKLSKYIPGINAAEVYGGTSMERQIMKLKRANIVVGTPGRIMDHLQRRTLKIDKLKLVVLDEADEMLNMGFKEDVEVILETTPEEKQVVLFSATMPPAILALTKQFQNDPQLVEVSKKKVTLDNITQLYADVAMGRKMDALNLLMHYYSPALTMVFCNTKAMVDEVTSVLKDSGFAAEGLHGDMKQQARTKVLDDFKSGKTSILVATDVAARGIDVNNIEYVINYDVPQNNEYYIHRIGRTGRAGKLGTAITICSGRKHVFILKNIAQSSKATISPMQLPKAEEIKAKHSEKQLSVITDLLSGELDPIYANMVVKLVEGGYTAETIAQAALQLSMGKSMPNLTDISTFGENRREKSSRSGSNDSYGTGKIHLNIGRSNRVAPNHIVAAITERTEIKGSQIGKIEIHDDHTIVAVPTDMLEAVLSQLSGLKICGKPTRATESTSDSNYKSGGRQSRHGGGKSGYGGRDDRKKRFSGFSKGGNKGRRDR